MIKRTLFISNPCYLSVKNSQLVYSLKDKQGKVEDKIFPIEDLGFIVLESPQITLSLPVLQNLLENNVAIIVCDQKHLPTGMFLNLNSNSIQQEIFEAQINASLPLKKQLWKQTVESKIKNQGILLKKIGKNCDKLFLIAKNVMSGDSTNQESIASRYYWATLFDFKGFARNPEGPFPNNLLNYGYSILRAATARALSGSGLLATLGIHHCNRYNAYCLADDIMEPYRPFIDSIAIDILNKELTLEDHDLTKENKAELLSVLKCDVMIGNSKRPLMLAISQTTASLSRCFKGEDKDIIYPVLN